MTSHIIVIAILLIFSAYFSATKTAFSSLNKTRIKALAEKDNKSAQFAYKLFDHYDKLLSTVLIGSTLTNVGVSALSALLFVELLGGANIGATVSTIVVTVVVLFFGEMASKSLAKEAPDKFVMYSAPFLKILIILLTPLTAVFSAWKRLMSKAFRTEPDSKMSQEELLMLIDEVQQEGSIGEDEGDLLRNSIEFTERRAEDILTHRMDLEAVPVEATKEQIAEVFSESKFSRILVYEDNLDNIVGVIHLKDFYTGGGIISGDIKDIISPAIFVLKNEKISSLLRKLQQTKSHIAVVLDEYGGTYGIVTMEDILEELVGDIYDEHDDVVEEFSRVSDSAYRVDCSTDLDEFCEHFDIQTDSEMVSLGGWVAEQLGKIPEEGDFFSYDNLEVTVTDVESHRAMFVEIIQHQKEDGASDTDTAPAT
jgi:CBS domain containing-hemolysin-like protein